MTDGYMREYYHLRKKLGLCPACGKKRDLENRVKCSGCLYKDVIRHIGRPTTETAEQKARRKELRDQRRENGLCILCGKPAYKGYTRCYECHLKNNRLAAERRRRNKKERTAPYTPPHPYKPGKDHPWNLSNMLVFRKTTNIQIGGDNR